jgi:AcrR family transcriptional regulator
MQPLRTRMRAATARDILASAEVVLAEKGMNASVAAIARHAGVAVGTIYNHFKDRDALLKALVAARRRDLAEGIAAAARATEGCPFAEQLAAFVEGALAVFDRHRAFVRIALEGDSALPRNVGRAAGAPASALQQFVARATELVALGQAEGALRAGAEDFLAAGLAALVRGVLFYGLDRGGFAAHAPAVVALFLDGARTATP